ncbi:MAG: hypothetical protein ACLFVE_03430 [Chitinispirillaceae bacterium]
MLQQTQVERVKSKYIQFIRKFPGFESLARASMNSIYPLWQGLGYNRRALAMTLQRYSTEATNRWPRR